MVTPKVLYIALVLLISTSIGLQYYLSRLLRRQKSLFIRSTITDYVLSYMLVLHTIEIIVVGYILVMCGLIPGVS